MTALSARHWISMGGKERGLCSALLASVALHLAGLAGAQVWGPCICRDGQVVHPKRCENPRPRISIELVEAKRLPLPPPPLARSAHPKQPAAVVVAPLRPRQPLAAPKRGHIVLPDEALKEPMPRPAETTAELPSLPRQHVIPQSEASVPVIATPEVFSRAESLVPGAPGEYGLGGTGKATGTGPFATAPEGSGTGQTAEVPAVPPDARSVPETRLPLPPPAKAPAETSVSPDGPTRPPALLNWTDPPYPERARQEGREGTVILRATISPEGRPARVEIADSSGSSLLDLTALSHMRNARFSPALRNGKPVGATISFRVRFRLIKPG
jgi:protein TonB